ncbi:FAD/NAD(P)-binding domain-containing protein [Thozetella sp. PMI_491]|nr:FAD/NAD(P)-binding domain-containing protein [Thozetella sp. PMI_491]
MPVQHIIILGAGPAGLSTAISLSRLPSSFQPHIRITVLELRAQISTLGGAVNLTPLALRYLDKLGAGARLRSQAIPVSAIELASLRTGGLLARLWPDVDAIRAKRHDLVTSLMETVSTPEIAKHVTVRFGVKVTSIHEEGEPSGDDGKVILTLDNGETIQGDVLIGCDGLHSAARSMYVDPSRKETYSGRGGAYGYARLSKPGNAEFLRPDGKPAVVDTTLVNGRYGSLLSTFCEPTRTELYMAAVMELKEEHGDAKDGWRTRGEDKAKVKQDIQSRFQGGKLKGLAELLEKVDDWSLFPVYQLPPNGRWHKGRVIIIGDAAHAVSTLMPPQGESTGIAIEDGVLLARLLERHESRSVPQIFDDYEKLRRGPVEKVYKETVSMWANAAKEDRGWLGTIILEWMTWVVVGLMNMRGKNHFAGDVTKLELPA